MSSTPNAPAPHTPADAPQGILLDPRLASALRAALAGGAEAPAGGAEASADAVRLAIDGKVTKSRRTRVQINGTLREMRDSRLIAILRAIAARERSLEAWSSRRQLEIGPSRSATTQIREVFLGLVPEGFDAFEGDRRGNFRLNPAIVVEHVDWDALGKHPNVRVAQVVLDRRKRRGGV